MQISDKHFLEFKELMREKVGDEAYSKMTEQELLESAIKLITLVRAVYKPMTKEDYEKYQVYEKDKTSPKSIENVPDKQLDNRHL